MDFVTKIDAYLQYLIQVKHYRLAIKDFSGFLVKEPKVANTIGLYCVHANSFCIKIKSNPKLWDRCMIQNKILKLKCEKEMKSFIGPCYAGVGELIIPVLYENKAIAAVCVSGINKDEPRNENLLKRVVVRYGLDSELIKERRELVNQNLENLKEIETLCGPLADYLLLYYTQLVVLKMTNIHDSYPSEIGRLQVLRQAVEYIRERYMYPIGARDIASFSNCSLSHLSHIFKRSMQMSISDYIAMVRINTAKRMLTETNSSMKEIAMACGFNDQNYFSSSFRKREGTSPSQFRQDYRVSLENTALM